MSASSTKVSATTLIDCTLRYLREHGCHVWRQNVGIGRYQGQPGKKLRRVIFGEVGMSDVLGWTPHGWGVAVEIKAEGDTKGPGQQAFVDDLAGRGGFACFIRSINDLEAAWNAFTSGHMLEWNAAEKAR